MRTDEQNKLPRLCAWERACCQGQCMCLNSYCMTNDELINLLKRHAAEGAEVFLDLRQGRYLSTSIPYQPTPGQKSANGYPPDKNMIVIPVGNALSVTNSELTKSLKGHAAECEVYLDDGEGGYLPISAPYRPSVEQRAIHGHSADKLMVVIPAETGLSES